MSTAAEQTGILLHLAVEAILPVLVAGVWRWQQLE
jgi:hypothetical protein